MAHMFVIWVIRRMLSVIFQSGRMMKFKKCNTGLYCYDTEHMTEHEITVDYSFVKTSIRNKKKASNAELERINLARYYQELFAWPSKEDLSEIIEEKQEKKQK